MSIEVFRKALVEALVKEGNMHAADNGVAIHENATRYYVGAGIVRGLGLAAAIVQNFAKEEEDNSSNG